MSNSQVSILPILEYDAIFEDIPPRPIEHYLSNIEKEFLQETGHFFLGFSSNQDGREITESFLDRFFGSGNEKFKADVKSRISKFEESLGSPIRIINVYSSLRLFEYVMKQPQSDSVKDDLEMERDLFFAYLLINQWQTENENKILETVQHLPYLIRYPAHMLGISFPTFEYFNSDYRETWITQVVKSIMLFKYLVVDESNNHLMNAFLNKYHCTTWKEYLKRYLQISFEPVKTNIHGFIDVMIPENVDPTQILFLDQCALPETIPEDVDFKLIREYPLLKVKSRHYRIIYSLFAIEKVFKGLYFELNSSNNSLEKDKRIKNFRSTYCDKFSEKTLFKTILKQVFKQSDVCFSGDELDDLGIDGAPDFYVRRNNSVYILESKDVLINASVRRIRDFGVYETELKNKFYQTDDGQSKAILQLVASIESLITNTLSYDEILDTNEIIVHPILVLHDHFYNVMGLNVLLNYWFELEIQKLTEKGINTTGIKPLIVCTINYFILYQDSLSENLSLIDECIQVFYGLTEIPDLDYFNKLRREQKISVMNNVSTPFDLVATNLLRRMGVKDMPSTLNELGISLFE